MIIFGWTFPLMSNEVYLADLTSCSESFAWIKHNPTDKHYKNKCSHWLEKHWCDTSKKIKSENLLILIPGKTKMKHAAKPPISEMTRPISGMKRARISVRQNQTSVCSILRLRSLVTSVSTTSPLKRNHKPSSTALKHKQIHIFSLDLTINMYLS